jgi:hypothetical protein
MASRLQNVITPQPESEAEDEESDLSEQSGSDEEVTTSDGDSGAEKVNLADYSTQLLLTAEAPASSNLCTHCKCDSPVLVTKASPKQKITEFSS